MRRAPGATWMQRAPTAISLVAMAMPNIPVRSHRPTSEKVLYSMPIVSPDMSVGQRIGTELEVHRDRLLALAAFHEPRRAITAGGPQPAALPAGARIVNAPLEALGVAADGLRHRSQARL